MVIEKLLVMRADVQRELVEDLIPFWQKRVIDYQNGGFIGRMESNGDIDRRSVKGLILNARLLWSYAALYQYANDDSSFTLAQRAFDYINKYFIDYDHGGAFWALDFKGNFLDTKKKVYGQAFCIYALAEYYKITQEKEVLDLARHFFEMIESNAWDPAHGGYFETFERTWKKTEDVRLSAVDMNEDKSMNTHLHVLEAYTSLLKVWDDKRVAQKLSEVIGIFLNHIIDPETHHFRLFFDESWTNKSPKISFGHDIEGSWLLVESAAASGDPELLHKTEEAAAKMATAVLEHGVDSDGGIFFEGDKRGITDSDKHWWPQAEAVVGFLNAFQLTGEEKFLAAGLKTWSFIKKHIIDKKNGEWYWSVSKDRKPCLDEPKVSEWKSAYHTCRSCIEIINRIDAITNKEQNL